MTDVEAESVPVIAVTAAVGAVVLLLVLLCNVGKKQENEEQEEKGKLCRASGNVTRQHEHYFECIHLIIA